MMPMKISNFGKNKDKIMTNETSSSMEVNITKEGTINVSTEEITFSSIEKDRTNVHIVSDSPTFNVDQDKNKKISVIMTPGVVGPPGPPGKDGADGETAHNFLGPITLMKTPEDGYSYIDGYSIHEGYTILEEETRNLFVIDSGMNYQFVKTLSEKDIFQIIKGNEFGGRLFKIKNNNLVMIKEKDSDYWDIIEVI